MTFGIFVSFDAYFKPVADLTMPVLAKYCERHGYSLTIAQNPPIERTLVWDRCLTMLGNIADFDWTIHMDADVLITNHDITLESLVEQFPTRDMILSRDHTGLNDGVVFSRYDAKVVWFDLWRMKDEVSSLAATWKYLVDNPNQTSIGEVPQKLFNAYPYSAYGIDYPQGTWESGDFAYHLPGKTTDDRVKLLTPMIGNIVW